MRSYRLVCADFAGARKDRDASAETHLPSLRQSTVWTMYKRGCICSDSLASQVSLPHVCAVQCSCTVHTSAYLPLNLPARDFSAEKDSQTHDRHFQMVRQRPARDITDAQKQNILSYAISTAVELVSTASIRGLVKVAVRSLYSHASLGAGVLN